MTYFSTETEDIKLGFPQTWLLEKHGVADVHSYWHVLVLQLDLEIFGGKIKQYIPIIHAHTHTCRSYL